MPGDDPLTWDFITDVLDIMERLQAAMVCDSVLLGGGNAKLMKNLPSHVMLGANSNAIDGGIKLWQDAELPVHVTKKAPKRLRSSYKLKSTLAKKN